jgi:transcriptional regulator with XRE-family HTH domain
MAATTGRGERVRRPNLLLRRCRELQGWSQADVAVRLVRLAHDAGGSRVQCGANVVGRWERGERRPGPGYVGLLCRLYGSTPEQLGLVAISAFTAAASAGARLSDDVERREFLRHAAALGAAAVMPARLPAVLAGVSAPTDEETVASIRSVTAGYRRLDGAVASSDLLAPVQGHLRLAVQLLGGARITWLRQRLAAAASEGAGFTAWLSIDTGDVTRAMEHYHLAVAAAQQAADPLLSAYMLGSMAALTSEQGAAGQALALCDTARRELERGAPPIAHTWLTTIEATALASTGDRDSAMSALGRAAAAAERTEEPDWPWLYRFGPEKVLAARGTCLLRLHDAAAAQAVLQDAMTSPALSTRRRGELVVELANSRLDQRDLDEGCSLLIQAVDLARRRRSQALLGRVQASRRRLDRWQDAAPVATLDAQLQAAWS